MSTEADDPNPLPLGFIRNLGFDEEGFERRERFAVIAECPVCCADVQLWDDTAEWTEGEDGLWHHNAFSGCAQGVCCDKLIIDYWEGCFVFDLSRSSPQSQPQPPEDDRQLPLPFPEVA